MKGTDVFAQYVEMGTNPEGANRWAIVKASGHKAIWKWCQPWCKGFRNNVEVIPILTDGKYLAVQKELD